MSDKATEKRIGDRRIGQKDYDGPERRVGERRLPTAAPDNDPDPTLLSDLDLMRAYRRTSMAALRAEIKRRGLDL
jgi:hypothetical protein